jgi:UDP-D-galactose:(glucosyl)LPS alpha-1,6-D-galactosyltransferase
METALSLIYRELKQRHNVAVILKGKSEDTAWEAGINTISLFHKINDRIPQKYLLNLYSAALSKAMKNLLPVDIIVSTGPLGVKAAGMALDRLQIQAPVVSWLHFNLDFFAKNLNDLQAADGHLAISEGIYMDMQCVFSERINKLVYNPVEYTNVSYVERPVNPIFLYVGRLAKVKRVDHMMKALSPLLEYRWELHIIGDGEEHESLLDLSRQLGIQDRIVWCGWRQRPWEAVHCATSLLLASDTEPFGLVLIEALSRGIPVISSDCKYGPREIVNHSNGWLYPSNAPEQLTSILKRILDGEQQLPSLESCRESVRKYAVETIA